MTSKSGDYWKQHILSWEAGAYFKDQGRNPPFWDRLSTLFRGDGMYVRMDAALGIIAPYLKDKTVLDLGCGTGRFAIRMLEAGAARVIGMDVSSAAIEIAERRAQGTYRDRLEFRVADLMHPETSLPPAGLITALGLIEYFDTAELDALLSDINQAGLGRSLQFELFRPGQINVKEYYAELPITVKVSGKYHDLGAFASDIANLPRIVTLNNMSIGAGKGGSLTLDATAKTYRYLDQDEIAAQRKAKQPAKGPAK